MTISGGNGGSPGFQAGAGGAGVSNAGTRASDSGVITTLTNKGTISGGNGSASRRTNGDGGAGGAGVSNAGTMTSLSNSGAIRGGAGGSGSAGGGGGAGVSNASTITTLTNSGTIEGGKGGAGATPGAAGDAIYSAGTHASIGPITNTGRIIGSVEIDNQASVTVTGGSGKTFGSWTGGMITIGNSDLTFASGNTALGDDISVDGGKGTVTNKGRLRVAAPETIAGNFTQAPAGVLGLDFAGDTLGEYGALRVSKLTTLDGGLAIDLTHGFTLAAGDRFDILGFEGLAGNFDALALDGAACMARPMDSWACGGGVRLREVIDATSLDLVWRAARPHSAQGARRPSPNHRPGRCSRWASLAWAGSA
jgi:hypothetical protein